jgi:outer membrane protein TolC
MFRRLLIVLLAAWLSLAAKSAEAQRVLPTLFPEQRSISVRDPSRLQRTPLPPSPDPSTVSKPLPDLQPLQLSLDEAIRTSLRNMEVVRVLAGVMATNSGRTIYDPAVTNTGIDEQNATFDPTLSIKNSWNRLENPSAIFDPVVPGQSLITGLRTDNFRNTINLSKQNALGGIWDFDFSAVPSRSRPGVFPLNPMTSTATSLGYTQPLLQGGRIGANLAPIVLARIDTERSYFQLKDTVQENVRGVIEGYWSLVAARTDVWARRQQVDQLTEGVRRIKARVAQQLDNRADQAQAELQLANFRANLVASEANVIQREAVLRNLLGWVPSDGIRVIPSTPPLTERFVPNWSQINELAGERRPDIIELKLILEADDQLWQIARNNALPRVDAVGLYRWNGLDGRMPNGSSISSDGGQFTDWTLGVNFSVPLGLRQSRAALRSRELIIARDRANLQQGLHNAAHILATAVRSLDQLYEQYLAFQDAREAARINLDAQLLRYRTGQTILLNVLQALVDWGNSVSSEASALTQYNAQLAMLERQTGTILETHGVVFYEERCGAIGPLGHFCEHECYPKDMRPGDNADRYPVSDKPAEDSFDLQPPSNLRERLRPIDDIKLPPAPDDALPDDGRPTNPKRQQGPTLERDPPSDDSPAKPVHELPGESPPVPGLQISDARSKSSVFRSPLRSIKLLLSRR